jgi:ubiquinol-cytochrome c reductase cytochrome b subunit
MGLLFFAPFTGRFRLGHRFNTVLLGMLGIGVVGLTFMAVYEDRNNPLHEQAVNIAKENADRAVLLARSPTGIPETGAISLLRSDPKTQGPVLFARHCASCHSHSPPEGSTADIGHASIASHSPSASNLFMYGNRTWLDGLLDPKQIAGPRYFGNTAHKEGDMVEYIQADIVDPESWTAGQIDAVKAALLAEAGHIPGDTLVEEGRKLIKDLDRCAQCHKFHEQQENDFGPDLTGYASRQWMIDFVGNPAGKRFYGGNNDRMPAYGKNPDKPLENILSSKEISLIVDWLRGDWYEPR